MADKNRQPRLRQREPLTDTMMLMLISIGIFVVMYLAAMLTLKGGFLKPQMFFDLLNDNAYLIIISCGLTIVMIGGGINISVGGVISLTVMSCALFLNSSSIQNDPLCILATILLALGIGLCFGLLQGFLVSYLDIQPFIVTLAGMFLARGLTTILSVNPVTVAHEGFQALVKTKLMGAIAMRCQSCSLPLMAVVASSNMLFQTTGKAVRATVLAVARQGVTFIPCVLLLPRLIDPAIWGVYLAQPIADLITFLTALPMAIHILKRFRLAVEDESFTP